MIKRLYDLPLRRKFVLIVAPLILIIALLDFVQIRQSFYDFKDAKRLKNAIILSTEINELVHEIQKERGISAGWIINADDELYTQMMVQRTVVDNTIAKLQEETENPDFAKIVEEHPEEFDALNRGLDVLFESYRKQILDNKVDATEIIDFYSNLNDVALSTVDKIIDDSRDKDAAQQVHAITNFLKSKELASIERAVGNTIFAGQNPDYEVLRELSTLEAAQESYIDAFLGIADEESESFYHKTMLAENVEEVDRLRAILHANLITDEDPNHWYNTKTRKINSMKKVEDFMTSKILERSYAIANESTRAFVFFVLIDILVGAGVILILSFVILNILANITALDSYTKKIIAGNYKEHVNIQTKDELGQYAETFNSMIDEIHKSHYRIRVAKAHVERILKQYQTVFANVQQGIFLLDKEFKIGKLYSRAMEKIFDVENVSQEPFASFMRPRIIPKDHEALEMFMRHLFNSEMNDKVLNEVNPIRYVKIFNETRGAYTTKYIEVTFNRIWKKEEINNIMVTITDVTSSVVIKKKLKEVEERKRREAEQMLSVLRVNPYLLKRFLHNSRKVLAGISKKFEQHTGTDYKQLINYSSHIAEDLKGTASVVGMSMLTDKLSDIENSLDKLSASGNDLKPKDFLIVLHKVNAVDKILISMTELLEKVTDTYVNLGPKEHIRSNLFLIELLENSISEISKKAGKEALFNFVNEKNIALPKKYTESFEKIIRELINNSLFHGIETAEEREERNKPQMGLIVLSIDVNEDKQLIVSYKDDGNGIDPQEIKKKAKEKGIISENEQQIMSDSKVAQLLFLDSYNESFNNESVFHGLPLVRSIIEELGGSFRTSFTTGRFFEITIILPFVDSSKPKLLPNQLESLLN